MDLSDLLQSWLLALKADGRADNTLTLYRQGVEAYLSWCDSEGLPQVLDRTQVRTWTSALQDGGAEPATVAARQSAVRRYSKWLWQEDEQETDPLAGMRPPKQAEKLVNPLTEDELKRLLKVCAGKTFEDRRDEAVIRVLANSGMRPGECAALWVSDVDLLSGLVVIRKSKTGKGRVAHIGPKTCAAVDRYLRMRRAHKQADGPMLWLGTRGRGFSYAALWSMVKDRAAQAEIEGLNPHRFRHTAATRWLMAGGSEGGAVTAMGWSSRRMLDRYTSATRSQRAADEARQLNLGDL
ncbi:tyrosine-type recombinase/integrase [Kribbella speibonae]|uniref:Integrase n=1 Tax=Kribbella speibonae TaxID=1572660 RepID=A0ABY2AD25_9ACTN|nr:tyrosine-type recombinase/integrase [Kribbella speibonae]TCC26732.1 integrase [Kribbella speibonae]